jgi:hypothetical protein
MSDSIFESDKKFYGCAGFETVSGNPSGKGKFERRTVLENEGSKLVGSGMFRVCCKGNELTC